MTPIILGSTSPRRKEILGFFNVPFIQVSPPFDELSVPFDGDPAQYALEIARGKAVSLAPLYPSHAILTADTVVYCNGKPYAKPADDAEALAMLTELAGKWQSVFTGMTLKTPTQEEVFVEETRVLFHAATPQQLEHYHKGIPCLDKAGAWAIQGAGSIIAERVEGCWYNAMGLSIAGLRHLLGLVDIDLWNHLK
jgi:septum formation protein